MRRLLALTAAAAAALVVSAPAQADTFDRCTDFGSRINACTARTAERQVAFGIVDLGRFTRGQFTITCTRGNTVYRNFDRLARDERRVISVGGLHRPTCVLSAYGFNRRGRPVVVRLSLISA